METPSPRDHSLGFRIFIPSQRPELKVALLRPGIGAPASPSFWLFQTGSGGPSSRNPKERERTRGSGETAQGATKPQESGLLCKVRVLLQKDSRGSCRQKAARGRLQTVTSLWAGAGQGAASRASQLLRRVPAASVDRRKKGGLGEQGLGGGSSPVPF